MANVNLKKDFKNGDKLYDHQLNNNFATIEAALAAMNKIVWQDSEEDGTSISAFKGDTDAIEARDLVEGQLLYNTETGETYIDTYVNDVLTRINTGSGNVVAIQSEEPTNDAVKLWIDTDELDVTGTEITDNYSTRDDIGYSARYTNEALDEVYDDVLGVIQHSNTYSTTEEINTGKIWVDGKPIYRKVIEYTTPAQTQYPSISLTEAGIVNFDTIYFAEGSYSVNGNNVGADPCQYIGRYINKNNKTLQFINTDLVARYSVSVLEYTKTTDQPITN